MPVAQMEQPRPREKGEEGTGSPEVSWLLDWVLLPQLPGASEQLRSPSGDLGPAPKGAIRSGAAGPRLRLPGRRASSDEPGAAPATDPRASHLGRTRSGEPRAALALGATLKEVPQDPAIKQMTVQCNI